MFVQDHAQALRCTRQTQGVFERMQMARAVFVSCQTIARRVDQAPDLIALRQIACQPVVLGLMIEFGQQLARFARRFGHIHIAWLPITVDSKVVDALLNDVQAFERVPPGLLRRL